MDANFVADVKKIYRERRVSNSAEKQWPPCHTSKFVRLELSERKNEENYLSERRKDKIIKQLHLNYCDLFKDRSGKSIRIVLVEGGAGIGKTSLCMSLLEDWGSEKLFQEFHLLLFLSLRHKKVSLASSLSELLKTVHSSTSTCESVATYLENVGGDKLLIVADGWDELSETQRQEDSFLYELLFGNELHCVSVLLTSRPSASAPLHRLRCIDQFIEIYGFNKESIKNYIQCKFCSDLGKGDRLLKELEKNPLVESVCSIPLNSAIICHLWHALEEKIPETMTGLYTKMILNFVLRNLQKKKTNMIVNLFSFDGLPQELQQPWQHLCEIAYNSVTQNKLEFSLAELANHEATTNSLALDSNILDFGLLQSSELFLDVGCETSYHFLHLTFQEYLAALHIVKQSPEKQLEIVKSFESSNFDMVWRFLFGFLFNHPNLMESQHMNQIIKTLTTIKRGLILSHCAFEAKNEKVNETVCNSFFKIADLTNMKFPKVTDAIQYVRDCNQTDFGELKTAYDCDAVLYVISNMHKCKNMEINFSKCGVRENQIRKLTDVLAVKEGNLQIRSLNISGNKLAENVIEHLFHKASVAFQSLEELSIGGNNMGNESINSILSAVIKSSSCNGLSNLDLSYCPSSSIRIVENMISNGRLKNLTRLSLRGSLTQNAETNDDLLNSFEEVASRHCSHLETLDLSENMFSAIGAAALGRLMPNLNCLKSISAIYFGENFCIHLDNTQVGDEGMCAFINGLQLAKRFIIIRLLSLRNNGISGAGIACLVEGIHSRVVTFCPGYQSRLSVLDLSDNQLGLKGAEAIAEILTYNQNLTVLILSRCQLTIAQNDCNSNATEVVRCMSQRFCPTRYRNTHLKILALDGNSFHGEGIHVLIVFIYLCRHLEGLICNHCNLTSNDLKCLFEQLTKYKSLRPGFRGRMKKWGLWNNKIDDNGVTALIDNLEPLFPYLCHSCYNAIDLSINKISTKKMKELEYEMKRHENIKSPSSVVSDMEENDDLALLDSSSSSDSMSPPMSFSDLSEGESCNDQQDQDVQLPHPLTSHSLLCSPDTKSSDQDGQSFPSTPHDVQHRCTLLMLSQALNAPSDAKSSTTSAKALGHITETTHEWERPVAEQMGLIPADVATINIEHPSELNAQLSAAMEILDKGIDSDALWCSLTIVKGSGYQTNVDTSQHEILGIEPPAKQAQLSIKGCIEPSAKRARLDIQESDTESSEITEYENSSIELPATQAQLSIIQDKVNQCEKSRKDDYQVCVENTEPQILRSHPEESLNHRLTLDDLALIQNILWEGRAKWYNIGLQLGLTAGTLDAIQQTNHCHIDICFTAMLKEWLSKDGCNQSWSNLARCLRTEPVGLGYLAENLPKINNSINLK